MKRLTRLLIPLLFAAAMTGCLRRYSGDPDPTPAHTFGRAGTVERGGGLHGPRRYCPDCEWAGTACTACRAAESAASNVAASHALTPVSARDEADHMISLLETNRRPVAEAEVNAGPVSPYSPLLHAPALRTPWRSQGPGE